MHITSENLTLQVCKHCTESLDYMIILCPNCKNLCPIRKRLCPVGKQHFMLLMSVYPITLVTTAVTAAVVTTLITTVVTTVVTTNYESQMICVF